VPDDPEESVFETNWQKLAAELETAGQADRRATGDEGAEQTTRRLKLVVKNALAAATNARGKKRR